MRIHGEPFANHTSVGVGNILALREMQKNGQAAGKWIGDRELQKLGTE